MLEAQLSEAAVMKRVIESIRDLVQNCNFDCSEEGISLQAMDDSHIALVSFKLYTDAFSTYRCDRNIPLGINVESLMKVLKSGNNDDVLTLRADDNGSNLNLIFEDASQDRISEYNLKLMEIEQENMAIPETEHKVTINMPSAEFQRICRDMSVLSESVTIEVTKDGVRFSAEGDIGAGSIHLKPKTDLSDDTKSVKVQVEEPVKLSFNLKYLLFTCKSGSLSNVVTLHMSPDVPIVIKYQIPAGYVQFFLAPKIEDDEE
ncbi:hypothetical protein DV451_002594 [Geotrichum candidum]|uniref:DNA sliding clamp PCNA n=1 Tax=Geotrichum candidum TaxID=1173061 RepID=A0A0J9X4H9_GEOCN|nr:hypothetical protein DV451_002594 [Geotrichum candidum]KAI9210185.1 hypothetical protein DS838_004934 [Geotrichum bryndzae]KAF5106100.1 hypothetical protein DV453_004217 [Geotrichum candidum]KAF5112480.1 hypothetical protein DV452_004018 [Geotrichum candidum]KAF5117768.1 hypothetical protein DV454_000862 [Geotrichum candidum]